MPDYSPETYLASLLTTPEQEARNLRASRSRQRILALGDALRHIGNIYTTTQGAPNMQFNDPVGAERTRYQQDKLLRDANNMKYFNYQQAKQAQDAKQRQWEATFNYNMGRDAAKMQAQQAQWDTQNKEKARQFDVSLGYRKENDEANRKQRGEHYAMQAELARQRNAIAAQNAAINKGRFELQKSRGGGGSSSYYTLPTMTGPIIFSKDFNNNDVGKAALMTKIAPYLTDSQRNALNSAYTPTDMADRILNQGISQWLMKDPHASSYMQANFGARPASQGVPVNYDDYIETDDDDFHEFLVED